MKTIIKSIIILFFMLPLVLISKNLGGTGNSDHSFWVNNNTGQTLNFYLVANSDLRNPTISVEKLIENAISNESVSAQSYNNEIDCKNSDGVVNWDGYDLLVIIGNIENEPCVVHLWSTGSDYNKYADLSSCYNWQLVREDSNSETSNLIYGDTGYHAVLSNTYQDDENSLHLDFYDGNTNDIIPAKTYDDIRKTEYQYILNYNNLWNAIADPPLVSESDYDQAMSDYNDIIKYEKGSSDTYFAYMNSIMPKVPVVHPYFMIKPYDDLRNQEFENILDYNQSNTVAYAPPSEADYQQAMNEYNDIITFEQGSSDTYFSYMNSIKPQVPHQDIIGNVIYSCPFPVDGCSGAMLNVTNHLYMYITVPGMFATIDDLGIEKNTNVLLYGFLNNALPYSLGPGPFTNPSYLSKNMATAISTFWKEPSVGQIYIQGQTIPTSLTYAGVSNLPHQPQTVSNPVTIPSNTP